MAEDTRDSPANESPAVADPPDGPEIRGDDVEGADPDPTETPEIAALKQERDDFYDRLLRKTAEFDNYRRRVERERRERADETVVELVLDLLLVADDFERALAVEAGEEAAPYRKGVELIHAKLHDLLKKRHITPIEALGSDFDPNLHQAVAQESSPGHRDGEVIDEMRRGYVMGDRLLRPAMVKVAKA